MARPRLRDGRRAGPRPARLRTGLDDHARQHPGAPGHPAPARTVEPLRLHSCGQCAIASAPVVAAKTCPDDRRVRSRLAGPRDRGRSKRYRMAAVCRSGFLPPSARPRDARTSRAEQMARSDHPHVIAPPPLIAAAAVAIGLVLDWLLPLDVLRALFSGVLRIVIGLVLVGAGGALALIAERAFHAGGTNVMPWKPSIVLVTTGVFSRLRNPMYVGLGLIVVGIAVALASDWTLIALGPAAIVLHRGGG